VLQGGEGARDGALLRRLWLELGGDPADLERVRLAGPAQVLPSIFPVTAFASASIALATLAAAELWAARRDAAVPQVRVDRTHASFAFRCENLLQPIGWTLPPLWDPIAGDYQARDGWIRVHTNYPHHRRAVERVLGALDTRETAASAIARAGADELEAAIADAGGCAAAMRDLAAWADHPQGRAVAGESVVALGSAAVAPATLGAGTRPLDGVRVLDLTRVIAGPVCTSFLAAYGAEVLRIDPPGFAEVAALLPETTAGKRRAALDLHDPRDRAQLLDLVRDAHVLVSGYRSDALARLGLDLATLRAQNPQLICATLDAYGFTGPWAARRGFDSLVQMSTGIAARGQQAYGRDRPVPLPAQALDHATGYLLAAGVCRAVRALRGGVASTVHASLARTACLLIELGEDDPLAAQPTEADVAPWLETVPTDWGDLRHVRRGGEIAAVPMTRGPRPGPLGAHPARWLDRA
jgi:crotonobetainyl-CoA:carnitine CoA-transferase CaiB-like acyl-CoA transferase